VVSPDLLYWVDWKLLVPVGAVLTSIATLLLARRTADQAARARMTEHLASLLRQYHSDEMLRALHEIEDLWEETRRHVRPPSRLRDYFAAQRGITGGEAATEGVRCDAARRRVSSLFVLADRLVEAGALDREEFVRGIGIAGVALYIGVVAELDAALAELRPDLYGDESVPAKFEEALIKRNGAEKTKEMLDRYRPIDWDKLAADFAAEQDAKRAQPKVDGDP
jgi:hypothetical protein